MHHTATGTENDPRARRPPGWRPGGADVTLAGMTATPLRRWLPLAVGLVLLTHAISLGHGFVDFDDPQIFLDKPLLNRADWGVVGDVFALDRTDDWRPVRDLSHWADFRLHGHDPLWSHIHHLTLLGALAALVGLFFHRVGLGGWFGCAALILAFVHPVQVEVIAWISGRKDLLAGVAFFGSLLAFLRFMRSDRPIGWALLTIAGVALGIMAKGHVIVAPGVLAMLWLHTGWRARADGIDGSPGGSAGPIRRRPVEIAGLIGVVFAGCLAIMPRIAAGNVVLPESYAGSLSLSLTLGDRIQLPLRYVSKLVWPVDLNHIYLTEPLDAAHSAMTITSAALVIGLVALAGWWLRRRDPRVALLAIVGGLMLPYMHFEPGVVYMADRYLFLAMPFVALLALDGLARLAERLRLARRVRIAVVALGLTTLAFASVGEHAAWRDPISLWTRMTDVYPQSDWGFDRLGQALYRAGRYEEAGGAFLAAADRDPRAAKHLNNAAVAAMALGRNEAAVGLLRRALALDPTDARALGNLRRLGVAAP